MEKNYPVLTDGEPVNFLLCETKTAFTTICNGIKILDTKLTSLAGIIITGLSAIALLGDSSKLPNKTPFLYFGMAFLAFALFNALLALAKRNPPVPDLSGYALLSTLGNIDNKIRIRFTLIEAWLEAIADAESIEGGREKLLRITAWLIVAGVLCFIANWADGLHFSTSPRPSAAHARNALTMPNLMRGGTL